MSEYGKYIINQRDDDLPPYFRRRRMECYKFADVLLKMLSKQHKSKKDLIEAIKKQNKKVGKSRRVKKRTIEKFFED